MAVTTGVKIRGEVIGVLVIVDIVCLPIKRPAQVSLPFSSIDALFYCCSLSLSLSLFSDERIHSMSW